MALSADITERRTLSLRFHGRVIDHLGLQMYQSPISAVAEMVANAWDADADQVDVTLPDAIGPKAEIVVADTGVGMTFEEVQEHYLNVGWNRRADDPQQTTAKERPLMGRKGIGKFAGFGIADIMEITTVSAATGEETTFALDLNRLRGSTDDYVGGEPTDIPNVRWKPRSDRAAGTVVRLRALTIRRRPSPDQFRKGLARRFLLLQRAADFEVRVDGEPLPETQEVEGVEYVYPRDYRDTEVPDGISVDDDGWGSERLDDGNDVRWRFVFYGRPITEEELRGVSVFAHGKLAQNPFFFNIRGGIGAQQGLEYLSGAVDASFLDDLPEDLISTERQRVDWNHPATQSLQEWGQRRLRELLEIWRRRRNEHKRQIIDDKVAPFSQRLARLPRTEAGIVRRTIESFAGIEPLDDEQFESLSRSVLNTWEGGRLRGLIDELTDQPSVEEAALLETLIEQKVLTTLHAAEAAKTSRLTIQALRERLAQGDLRGAVRDHVAHNPWLLSPRWEAFRPEPSIDGLLDAIDRDPDVAAVVGGRVDVTGEAAPVAVVIAAAAAIPHGHSDLATRFTRAAAEVASALSKRGYSNSTCYLLIDEAPDLARASDGPGVVRGWRDVLADAEDAWQLLLRVLVERAPEDDRIAQLLNEDSNGTTAE
jgi:hypothetical protein